MDKIIIKNLQLMCNIGITAEERSQKQPIIIDVCIFKDLKEVGKSDDIEKTINYSSVAKMIIKISENQFNTIEALAENIAEQTKTEFKPEKVKVVVKKPEALVRKGALYAAVEIER